MISVTGALEILQKQITKTQVVQLPILDCLDHFSAEDINAPIDVPSFDNSAMDGYCFAFEDYIQKLSIKVKYLVYPGIEALPSINKGEAARIFTGAPLPKRCDTVVIQERAKVVDNVLLIDNNTISLGDNVRLKGTQNAKGQKILTKHSQIKAPSIGFLATFGINYLRVFKKPIVGIIVTGKELVKPPKELKEGFIYESNSLSLQASLLQLGIKTDLIFYVDDDKNILKNTIINCIGKVDALIITGGVSVGDYDFVRPALQDLGASIIFSKVNQKPGKPICFSIFEGIPVFALPGNPAAVLTCFYVYIKPFLRTMVGASDFSLNISKAFLKSDYSKKDKLTLFLKAVKKDNEVEILSHQLSYQMNSFQFANCIVKLDDNKDYYIKGDLVELIDI